MTPPDTLTDLLGATVRVGSVRIGEVVGVFLDAGRVRAIGLEVGGADGARRFLPWVAARFEARGVTMESALLLVDDGASYERLGAVLVRDESGLRNLQATPNGRIERLWTARFGSRRDGYQHAVSDDPAGASSAYSARVDRLRPPAMLPRRAR